MARIGSIFVSFCLSLISASALFSQEQRRGERGDEIQEPIVVDAHAVANVVASLKLYRNRTGLRVPETLDELDLSDVAERYSGLLGTTLSDRFMLINDHEKLPRLPGWELIMISREPVSVEDGQEYKRFLIYTDKNGNLSYFAENEQWFENWIGGAIPGIVFGEPVAVEETKIIVPEPSSDRPSASVTEEPAYESEVAVVPEPAEAEAAPIVEIDPSPQTTHEERHAEPSKKKVPPPVWALIVGALILILGFGLVVARKKSSPKR